MWSTIGSIFVGLIVGLIARAIKPGDDSMGWVMTILLGIAGSFGATQLGLAMGWYQPGQSAGWIMSILGAIVLLFIYGMIKGKAK